jgi:hypothetical protein
MVNNMMLVGFVEEFFAVHCLICVPKPELEDNEGPRNVN